MEAAVFIGIQASGKSTFCRERFFDTHVRVSLDLLKTRNRERRLLELCLETGQRFVVDNTNPTVDDRRPYIERAKASRFEVVGYYFSSKVAQALERNAGRANRVPDVAILSTAKRLEQPSLAEGFDRLFYVRQLNGRFEVQPYEAR